MRLQCCLAKYREMQRNAEKCREKQRNAEKRREMHKKFREMQRIASEMRNEEKCIEMQICRDILMIFMTHGNVKFDSLDPPAFKTYSAC